MTKYKILVVDDEESLCEILQFNLEVEGYEVDVAYSAEQALDMTNATTESLTELRSQIDKLDDELLELLSRRMRVSRDIGQYKKEHNMPVLQAQRYEELLARRADQAIRMGMDREFMRSVLQAIHEESIRQQMAVLGE